MKRIIAICFALALLPACAQLKEAFQAVSTVTASITNPVTPDMLYDAENGAIIAFAALNAYKKQCVQRTIAPTCRTVIKKVQSYTRRMPAVLANLRTFVRANDQVNAIGAYNELMSLIRAFKGEADANNIPVGAM